MRILEDTPILPAGGLLNQGGPEQNLFVPTKQWDIVMETISIYDMGAIWDVAKPNTQPAPLRRANDRRRIADRDRDVPRPFKPGFSARKVIEP